MPSPSGRTRTALRGCGVALAGVLVLGAAAACTSHDETSASGPSHSASAHASGATEPTTAPTAGASATPKPSATGDAGTTGDKAPTGAGTDPAAKDSGSAAAKSSETLPDQPAVAPLMPLAPTPIPPSLTGPLPATGAANGALVAGFPKDVVPIPSGVQVVSSSVSSEGTRLQVGMEGSSKAAVADVQGAYVAALSGAGFVVADSPALPGTTATSFTRGPDGLVLTLRDRVGGGTELTVAGTLTTAG